MKDRTSVAIPMFVRDRLSEAKQGNETYGDTILRLLKHDAPCIPVSDDMHSLLESISKSAYGDQGRVEEVIKTILETLNSCLTSGDNEFTPEFEGRLTLLLTTKYQREVLAATTLDSLVRIKYEELTPVRDQLIQFIEKQILDSTEARHHV